MKLFLREYKRNFINRARYHINRIIADITEAETYWDYDLDGQGYKESCFYSTLKSARGGAEEEYAQLCEDSGDHYFNGETTSVECTYIQFFLDKNGNARILQEITEMVEFEYYHGDYAEHFSQRDYI